MAWAWLFLAGLFEVGWAVGLKYTEGFSRLWPTVWTVASMVLSLGLLGLALRTLPLGTAYAVWTGVGTIGTVALGIWLFQEPCDAAAAGLHRPDRRGDRRGSSWCRRGEGGPARPSRLAAPAAAQDTVGPSSPVGSRCSSWARCRARSTMLEDFLPLTSTLGLADDPDDPVLDGAVVQIERKPSPPAYLFSPEGLAAQFRDTARVPDALRIEGYEVPPTRAGWPASSCPADVPEPDFLVTCEAADDLSEPDASHPLRLLASYPLDPPSRSRRRSTSRRPFAELHGRFEPIADGWSRSPSAST
jgi:quaternary ammonium compound-resistance protein SugE